MAQQLLDVTPKNLIVMVSGAKSAAKHQIRWHIVLEADESISREFAEFKRGIVLIVGHLHELKVDAIPLLRSKVSPRVTLVDRFMMGIRNYNKSYETFFSGTVCSDTGLF
ncbi:hypothetical protein V6N11_069174 [Hibiscus sabdariffa]|uniref:Uncharacterized protein n=1 Tax=Hibiscus sabdariffa TaxID=183260 RepID=A0ABR2NAV7_9ROSI